MSKTTWKRKRPIRSSRQPEPLVIPPPLHQRTIERFYKELREEFSRKRQDAVYRRDEHAWFALRQIEMDKDKIPTTLDLNKDVSAAHKWDHRVMAWEEAHALLLTITTKLSNEVDKAAAV
jgi:hypothetical protein